MKEDCSTGTIYVLSFSTMSFLWVAAGVGLGFSAFGLRSASQSFSNSADKVKSSKFVSGTLVTAKEGGLKAPESGSDCLAFRFRKFRLTEDVIVSCLL